MTYLKNTTLVNTLSIHGWVATVEIDNEDGLYHAVVEIPFKEDGTVTHFLNTCASDGAGALSKLADKLYTASSVMLYLNPWEDKTNEKVHEFGLLIASHATTLLRAA